MAALNPCSSFALLFLCIFLGNSISPAIASQGCPVKFTGYAKPFHFENCQKLEQLGATLSWTYDPAGGPVEVAFRAKPEKPRGWVSWGINPTAKGMAGTQALIAYRDAGGSASVGKYDIKSYSTVKRSDKLSVNVTDVSTEFKNHVLTIFAKVELPPKKTVVNHVWQVGGAVSGDAPAVHAFDPENLKSAATIDFAAAPKAPAPQGANAPGPVAGGPPSGGGRPSSSPPSAPNASSSHSLVVEIIYGIVMVLWTSYLVLV